MANPQWTVDSLQISTNTLDSLSDRLYANGRMKVRVIVGIVAYNRKSERYFLTDSELDSITLVDYYSPYEKLSGSWSYTSKLEDSNGETWATSIDNGGSTAPVVSTGHSECSKCAARTLPQYKIFFVSSTTAESKRIGAAITSGDGVYHHTNSQTLHSSIMLNAIAPIVYTSDMLHIMDTEIQKIPVGFSNGIWYDSRQQNYYIKSDRGPFKCAKVYKSFQDDDDSVSSYKWNQRIRFKPNGNEVYCFFIWEMGVQRTKSEKIDPALDYAYDMEICNQSGSLCIARIHGVGPDDGTFQWGKSWGRDYWFEIFDHFGNSGKLKPVYHIEKEKLELQDLGTNYFGESDERVNM
ncbi:hypothetical protein H072_10059 [Dactylellina haptotyla CBS 200.50]|uniref:Uncharacterized protein n=1 Tax=Dactylellina haptotyla (strain CBS 200.50) TaxID=1284197 RepID=S8A5N6_DACHA|nr:hypothetical protein H072_10059 [Dactylellina haptotyla CBS 200.50]